jgi:hypothetical protein
MIRTLVAAAVLAPSVVLLLPVFLFAALAVSFTAAVRSIARLIEPSFMLWSDLIAFDRRLGWKYRPNLDTHYLAQHDDVYRIVTDGEGWPGRGSLDESRVVVIGDSFAAGYGVDIARSFSEISSLRVKAVGALGYSMVHGVLLMEQLGLRLAGKLVVWFAYLENDLQDNLAPEMRQYRTPFVRINADSRAWEIVDAHVSPEKWGGSNADLRRLFPRMCVPGPFSDRAYSAAEYLIGRAQAACVRAGAPLVVVTIPHPMQLTPAGLEFMRIRCGPNPELCDEDLPDRRIAESCRKRRVPMIAAKQFLSPRDYKRREGIHWNERGHRRMAGLLEQLDESFRSGALDKYIPGAIVPMAEGITRRPAESAS